MAIQPDFSVAPAKCSASSSFYQDGFRDAQEGLPESPPGLPGLSVLDNEYREGYRDGSSSGRKSDVAAIHPSGAPPGWDAPSLEER
ncbi:hypothetical protein P3T23_008740 [Paraburkholderia sp. GAS448]